MGKQVGRLSIRVLPDATKFRDDLRLMIKRVESSMAVNLTVKADTREAQLAIAKFVDRESAKGIDLRVGVSTLVAKAQLAVLSRDRTVSLFVKVNEASLAKTVAGLGALSGTRLVGKILGDVNDKLSKIDINIPKIARVALGIASLGSTVLVASAGIVTLAGDLAKMGNAGLILPAMFTGLVVGITTLALALKDAKTELASLGPAMGNLQDIMSTEFWDKAKGPILSFVNSILPQLNTGFGRVANALGLQAAGLAGAFEKTFAGGVLLAMFDRLAETMNIVTGGTTAFAETITTLGTVGSNYLPRLATWVVAIGDSFNNWLQDGAVSGRLDALIEDGITQMKYFGSAIDGLVGILRGIDSAATAAGGGGLKSFADAMQTASAAVQSPEFQKALTAILIGASAGMAAIGAGFTSFGGALQVLAPTISTVLTLAGEAIGGLITAISGALEQPEFRKGLTDFFEGIKTGVDALGPAMEPLFAFLGQLGTTVGVMAANFGPLLAVIKETFAPVLDSVLKAVTPLIPMLSGALNDALTNLGPVFAGLGGFIADNEGLVRGLVIAFAAIVLAIKAAQIATAAYSVVMGVVKGVQLGYAAASYGMAASTYANTAASKLGVAAQKGMAIATAIASGALYSQAAAWAANTAAIVANKAQTVALVAMYAKDLVVALAKSVVGLVASTGAWIANTAAQIGSKVALIAGAVASGIATAAQYALNLAMTLNPIGIIIAAIVAIVAALIWFFTQTELGQDIWANFTKFLGEAWNNIVAVATVVFTALGQFFTDLWNGIVAFITTVIDAIMFVFFNFNPIGIIISNWEAISKFFVDLWNNLVAFFGTVIDGAVWLFTHFNPIGIIVSNWDAIAKFFTDLWNGIVKFIGEAITNVQTVIRTVIEAIASAWAAYWDTIGQVVSDAWTAISGFVTSITDGIGDMIGDIGETLAGIPAKVGEAFANAGTWLYNAGASIIQGLIDGVNGMIGMAKDAAKGVMDAIANFFPHSPAKEGPFSGRGWTLYSGRAMGESLVDGMESRTAAVRAAARTMIGAAMPATASQVRVDSVSAAATSEAGTHVTVQGDVGYNPQEIADEIEKKKKQAAILAGIRKVGPV